MWKWATAVALILSSYPIAQDLMAKRHCGGSVEAILGEMDTLFKVYGFPFDREVAQEVAYPMCVSLLSQRNLVELIRMEFTQDYAKTIPY